MLAAMLTIVLGLATGAVSPSLHWIRDPILLWSTATVLVVAAATVGVLQAQSAGSHAEARHRSGPAVKARSSTSANMINTVTGTLINGQTVIIGQVSPEHHLADKPHEAGSPGSDHVAERVRDTLPRRNPVFTGRVRMLDEIEASLQVGPVAVVAVRGLGGVGKSQVALEFAHRMRDFGRYGIVGWVRADSQVTIAEDLATLAAALGLAADKPVGQVAADVLAMLGSRQDWLLVYDNAQNPEDLISLLPRANGHILITSRNRAWSGLAAQLDLYVFDRDESVALLRERTRRDEPEAAGDLAAELGDLPLALAQAAAYIDTNAITIAGYLDLYRDPDIARRLRAHGLESAEYPASVARTWLLHFDQLSRERPAAVELLRLCAFLDPDEIDLGVIIPAAHFAGEVLAAAIRDPLERAETVGALARASLVNIPAEGQLRVHRLVQAVTRDQLDDQQGAEWARRALKLLGAEFPAEPWDSGSWPDCAGLAAHLQAAVAIAESYPELSEACRRLLGDVGMYLAASAQHLAWRSALEHSLDIQKSARGPSRTTLVNNVPNLGLVEQELGDTNIARATKQRAAEVQRTLEVRRGHFRHYDPDFIRTLVNLGMVQRLLGDLKTARNTIEEAWFIGRSFGSGYRHPEYVRTLVNLAIVEEESGDLESARTTLKRTLVLQQSAYGRDHPQFAKTLAELGNVQRLLGDLRTARETLQRALAITEESYGPRHAELAKTLGYLGVVQRLLGDREAARASAERAQSILEAAYGLDHPTSRRARQLLQA
ncbi:MAG TPA: FxSxx-COOH system tetratricopeptide repeat protein [Streptosporangiaceae bacterium]|nr:FxSxx-COOH system tetratricopeptide repeat protein [Streptosporangiaceae bacterium]